MSIPLLICRIAKQNDLYVLTSLNAPQVLRGRDGMAGFDLSGLAEWESGLLFYMRVSQSLLYLAKQAG